MNRRRLPYQEGDWFAVPLEKGGYALGLVARCGPRGRVLFGYFFGTKGQHQPSLKDTQDLKPADAILVGMFGDLDLIEGKWPIIGHSEHWNRDEWPMPLFVRTDSISGKTWLVEYSEDDPNHEISATSCDPEEALNYPADRMMGSGAVEIYLTKLLCRSAL